MCAIVVDHEEFNSFLFAVSHFPEGTPNRFELVAEFVRGQPKEENASLMKVCLNDGERKNPKHLPLTEKTNCRTVFKVVHTKYPLLLKRDLYSRLFKKSGKSAFKPVILLPTKTQCCGKKIKIDSRPSFPLVYTMQGTYVGALFHGQCENCKMRYFPNYKMTTGVCRIYSDVQVEKKEYFQVSAKTVFHTELLKDIACNVWVSGATFQSRAKVYNLKFKESDSLRLTELQEFARTNDEEWELNEQRVNDAFFLWIVVNYFSSKGKLADTDLKCEYSNNGKRLNTEDLCKVMWEDICVSTNEWVTHTCKTPGCSEGYVTVDGNEYLKRSKCALPMEKVKIRKDLPQVYKCCPNSPLPGGKNQKPSKFCASHQSHNGETASDVCVPPEFHSARAEADLIPEELCLDQQSSKGCKKKENISLFFQTTAGMLALIRPCGLIVGMTEMFTSESYTQVFLFILRTFCADLEQFKRLKYLGYDRACGLVPFLKNQAKNGSAGAKLLMENVKFLVDIFHVSKHTEDVCMPPDNPNCLYHPHLPMFEEIKGVNTESCEQGFRRLNQYFELTRKMTQHKRNVLFWFVNDCFNRDLEDELKKKKLM